MINARSALQNPAASASWYQQHKTSIKLLLLLCSVAFLISVFFIRWQAVAVLAFLGVLSLLYNIPDQYLHKHHQSIRSVPLLKIFVIAFVWASIGSWLPYHWSGGHWQAALWLFVAQFCFIMAITLPFDIRDYQQDEDSRLLTIPGIIGIRNTRWLAVCFLLLHLVIMLMFFGHTLVATLLFVAASAPLLVYAHCNRPYWYFTGLLDGLILLQYLLLLILV
ncbi:MAG: UbiA family prenyltransferase [Bacteroidetes bacterium]|nr:UbiA family prenyltransferase [Bacteroidota bacterium]